MKRIIFIFLLLPFAACTSSQSANVGIDSLITLRENEKATRLSDAIFLADQIFSYVSKKESGIISDKELKEVADPLQAQLNDVIKTLDSVQLKDLQTHQSYLMNKLVDQKLN